MSIDSNSPAEGTGSISITEAAGLLMPEEGEREETEAPQDEAEMPESESEPETEEVEEEGESEEDVEAEEEPTEPEALTLEIDGEQVTVTPAEIKASYMRQKDYTRKTQELAQQRKAAEAEFQAVREEREVYARVLQQMAQQVSTEQEPDWDALRATDPIEYSLQMADWQRKQQRMAAVQAEQQRLAQVQGIEQQKMLAQHLQREQEALMAALPEWKDSNKAKSEKQMVLEQGKKLGFSDEELQGVTDHRAVVALRKAALYDALMAKKSAIAPTPGKATIKPSGKPAARNESARAYDRLKQSGKMRDAAAVVESLLFSKK